MILFLSIAILLGYQISGVLIDLNKDASMTQLKGMLGIEDVRLKINMASNRPAPAAYGTSDYWMRVGLMNGLAVLVLIPMCQIRAADTEIGARGLGWLRSGVVGSARGW